MLFVLLFIRFPVICQVLGGVPDNARVMGCTCANSPSLPTFLFVYYSEYYSVIPCRELCCCSRNCCWSMLFVLLFIRFPVICQVLGGVPDNARVMGCTCANSPSLTFKTLKTFKTLSTALSFPLPLRYP
jgi:hypothetical protein